MPSERNPRGRDELTRDPIFLFQPARWIVTDQGVLERCLRSWYDDECDREGQENVGTFDQWACDYALNGDEFEALRQHEAAVRHWDTERVYLTREEAEAYGRGRAYNYPLGWRVYCVCCEGELAGILREYDAREADDAE